MDRLAKITANPFHNWAYTNPRPAPPINTNDSNPSKTSEIPPSTYIPDIVQINTNNPEMVLLKPVVRRGRKRTNPASNSESEPKRSTIELKNNKDKEKENKGEKEQKEQIQLQELYYATMEGDKDLIVKEHKSSLHFKVCSRLVIIIITEPQ